MAILMVKPGGKLITVNQLVREAQTILTISFHHAYLVIGIKEIQQVDNTDNSL